MIYTVIFFASGGKVCGATDGNFLDLILDNLDRLLCGLRGGSGISFWLLSNSFFRGFFNSLLLGSFLFFSFSGCLFGSGSFFSFSGGLFDSGFSPCLLGSLLFSGLFSSASLASRSSSTLYIS